MPGVHPSSARARMRAGFAAVLAAVVLVALGAGM